MPAPKSPRAERRSTSKPRSVKKRAYHHGDLREALLVEATRSVAREGHPALSIREVARRVGVTHTAAYHHFPTREALLASVAEQAFVRMTEALVVAASGSRDPSESLGLMGHAYVAHACAHAELYRLMFSAETSDRVAFPELGRAGDGMFAALTGGLRACQDAGLLRAGPAAELGLVAWSAVHGLCSLLLESQLNQAGIVNLPRERVTAIVLEGVFSGLVPKNGD